MSATAPTAKDFQDMLTTFSEDFDSKVEAWRQAPNPNTQQAVKYAFDALTETLKICATEIQGSKITILEKATIMDQIANIYNAACKECSQKTTEFSRFISGIDFEENEDEDEDDFYISTMDEDDELDLPPTPPPSPSERLGLSLTVPEAEESREGDAAGNDS